MKLCSIVDCGVRHYARGWCFKHYRRWWRNGDQVLRVDVEADARYYCMHGRVRRARGPAKVFMCACGAPAREWAYDHTDPLEHSEHGMLYSLDVDRYVPMCYLCHKRLDNAWMPPGHLWLAAFLGASK